MVYKSSTGGSSSGGISSLNGETGDVTLTSTGNTVAITAAGQTINLEVSTSSIAATTFNLIGSGSNTVAAMVVGSGATLVPTGSGAIVATQAPAGTLTGTSLGSTVVTSFLTQVGTVTLGTWSGTFGAVSGANLTNLTAANISAGSAVISVTGTAASLQTPRAINGVNFDGTAPITVPAAAASLTGTGIGSAVVNSFLTKVGTVTLGAWSATFGVVSGAPLTNLTAANISAGTASVSITGNAGTADALRTPRAINGINFDGTAAITVPAAAGTLTGTTIGSTVVSSSLTSVGTLTNLTVTNPISGSVTGSSGSVVSAPAGTLTGTTIGTGVVTSSLTSVGTLGSLTVTNQITGASFAPSSTSGIIGTTTNNDAAAGSVGEIIAASVISGSAVFMTTNVTVNVMNIPLTAGDWDVSGLVNFLSAATTSMTTLIGSITQTSGVADSSGGYHRYSMQALAPGSGTFFSLPINTTRIKLAGTATIYLVAFGTFTLSTLQAWGNMYARRAR